MYAHIYIYIYMYIYIYIYLPEASRRGRDKRGRRRSAAVPPWSTFTGKRRANCGHIWQNVAKYDKMWQHVRMQSKILQNVADSWPFGDKHV